MLERSRNPVLDDHTNSEVATVLGDRDTRSARYTMKIETFSALSQLMQDAKMLKYESDVFEAGSYKWKLSLYPTGDKERNGEGYISLYLVIAETDNLPLGWDVNVYFKLFVFDQIQDKYTNFQDANGTVRRFHMLKTDWGSSQLLPLGFFNNAANGYLIDDTCVFGAEVSVLNHTVRGECLTLQKEFGAPHTWKVHNFSSLGCEVHYSDVFTIGNHKWRMHLHPNGDFREKGKFLSLFLVLDDCNNFPSERKTYGANKLRIVNQGHGQNIEITGTKCFSALDAGWGRSWFLSLTDLCDSSKGFLVNDTLIVEAEVSSIFTVTNLSD